MSWSKIKTLLIFLFLFVNIYLITNLYIKNDTSREVSAETVADTIKILEANNITIDKDIIKRNTPRLRRCSISNSIDKLNVLAENLLGPCSKTDTGYENKSGRVDFNSVAFLYENYNSSVMADGIRDNNAIEKALEILEKKGFDVKDTAVRDFSAQGEVYSVRFGKNIDDLPFYEGYLLIVLSKEGQLISIEGYWPEINQNLGRGDKYIVCTDETKVLINLLNVDSLDKTKETEIVDIKMGYTLGVQPESDSPILLTLLPAYRVILKNGENYIFSAETAEFIYKY